jgi:hypothetical protein
MMPLRIVELVGTGDIAKRCGVTRSSPGAWERRYADFPKRMATINEDVGIWDAMDIDAWCRKTGRMTLEEGHIYDDNGYDITKRALSKAKGHMS